MPDIPFDPALWLLFGAAFAAATLFPFQSEIVLVGLLVAGEQSTALLVAVATVGNTLGSCANWALGRWLRRFSGRRWFPAGEAALCRAEALFKRWGLVSLLFAWAPFMGDPLTVVAGTLRVPFLPFVILVGIGKGARYLVLAAVTLGVV